jgi:uncharacterized protein (TIGR01777 family)
MNHKSKAKKVIITGGSGFLGQALTEKLLADGFRVVVLDLVAPKSDAAEFVSKNLLTEDIADPRLEDPYAVVNLAGKNIFGRWTQEFKQAVYDTRVRGTENLVQLFSQDRFRPEVFVSASAVGYYGDRGDKKLTVDVGPGDGFLAKVAQDWERAAYRATDFGVPTTVLRNGHILGDGGLLAAMLPLYRLGLGGPLGSGEQYFPWIHIADITRLYTAAIKQKSGGRFNAVANQDIRNREFSQCLADVLDRPHILRVPKAVLRLRFGGFADEMLFSQRAVSQAETRLGVNFAYPQVTPALKNLLT